MFNFIMFIMAYNYLYSSETGHCYSPKLWFYSQHSQPPLALTKLQKCVPPVADFLSGTWERCIGSLKINMLYQDALHN